MLSFTGWRTAQYIWRSFQDVFVTGHSINNVIVHKVQESAISLTILSWYVLIMSHFIDNFIVHRVQRNIPEDPFRMCSWQVIPKTMLSSTKCRRVQYPWQSFHDMLIMGHSIYNGIAQSKHDSATHMTILSWHDGSSYKQYYCKRCTAQCNNPDDPLIKCVNAGSLHTQWYRSQCEGQRDTRVDPWRIPNESYLSSRSGDGTCFPCILPLFSPVGTPCISLERKIILLVWWNDRWNTVHLKVTSGLENKDDTLIWIKFLRT